MAPIVFWLTVTGCTNKDTNTPNEAPTITIVSPVDGEVLTENDEVQLLAQVTDPDHFAQDLTIQWSVNGDVVCDWTAADAGGNSTCPINVSVDMAQIRAEVQDPDGASALQEISVNVDATEPPVVEILSPVDGDQYYSDQDIPISASVVDVDNSLNSLELVWTSSIDGNLTITPPDSDGLITDVLMLSQGTHTIQFDANDPDGKSDSVSVDIVVTAANNQPLCEIISPTSGEFSVAGAEVTFTGTASDPDIDPELLNIAWVSDIDGELYNGIGTGSGEVSFSSTELSLNTHQITLSVSDEMGLTCEDTIQYSIGTPPSILLQLPYVDTLINEGESLTFSANVSDTEQSGSELMVEWESDIDGQLFSGYAASNGISQFQSSSLSFGTHTITAMVTDFDNLYATGTVSIIVNAIPTQPSVIITPDPATTSYDLVVTATGSTDFDGTTPTYNYEWFQDGLLTSNTGTTISSSDTLKNETWLVRVTPTDGITNGPSIETSIVVSNTAPAMTSISVSPQNATTQNDLTCSYAAGDVDPSDSVTFSIEWYINSQLTPGAGDVLSGPFTQGDLVTCRVTPNDGFDLGSFAEASTNIINTAPTLNSVTLSPSSNATNDIITATIDSSDLDGDTLTHTWIWYVDNQAVQNTTNNGISDTLDGTIHFERDQQIYVDVTVDDGVAVDSATSSTQVIENTPPSAFNIFIDPISPVVGVDDLECVVQTADIDGDPISTSYSWTLDGQLVGFTNNVIPTSQISDGEVWECTVIADDGTDLSPPVTASTVIGANVEAAVGQDTCAAAGLGTDGNYDLTSCLSDISITAGEISDSSGYVLQMGAHYVYTPE